MDAKAVVALKAKGMTITEVTPQERQRMKDKLRPVVDKHNKTISESLLVELHAELAKTRASK